MLPVVYIVSLKWRHNRQKMRVPRGDPSDAYLAAPILGIRSVLAKVAWSDHHYATVMPMTSPQNSR